MSKNEQIQIDVASVRALLDDLYNDVGNASDDDIRAGIDACSTMLRDTEELLDE